MTARTPIGTVRSRSASSRPAPLAPAEQLGHEGEREEEQGGDDRAERGGARRDHPAFRLGTPEPSVAPIRRACLDERHEQHQSQCVRFHQVETGNITYHHLECQAIGAITTFRPAIYIYGQGCYVPGPSTDGSTSSERRDVGMRSMRSTRSRRSSRSSRFGASAEQLGEAHEIIAAGVATRAFIDELRRVSPGDVVTVVGIDGVPVRGRILSVGADWLRLGEVADETGSPAGSPAPSPRLPARRHRPRDPGVDRMSGYRVRVLDSCVSSARYASSAFAADPPHALAPDLQCGQLAAAHQRVHLRDRHVQHARDLRGLQQGRREIFHPETPRTGTERDVGLVLRLPGYRIHRGRVR